MIHTQLDDGSVPTVTQVHEDTVIRAGESGPADGIYVPNGAAPVGIRTADCLPLGLVGKEGTLLLHVSRKTLVAGLLDRVPEFLDVHNLQEIYIGPHICADHFTFEWEGQGIAEFKQKFPDAVVERNGIIYLSLRTAFQKYINKWASRAPVKEDERCTFEDTNLPSYKRWLQAGKQGKLAHLITTVV